MAKTTAIYTRVSTNQQSERSQRPDLERWLKAQENRNVKWFRDSASGTSMNRPGWKKLDTLIQDNKVKEIVVWRLDRLGRTASGLTKLFEELNKRNINLVSIKDGLDLKTPAGRLQANILASVAAYETEVRGERVKAGQAAARAAGKTWGGRGAGRKPALTDEDVKLMVQMKKSGVTYDTLTKRFRVSKGTVVAVINGSYCNPKKNRIKS